MIPALLLLRAHGDRGILVPVPLFLLWPLIAVGGLGIGLAYLAMPRKKRSFLTRARLALSVLLNLHGLKIAERGGKRAKKRAAVAVGRKLAVLLLTLLKTGEDYEPLREGNVKTGVALRIW